VGNTSASFRTERPSDIDPGAFRWLATAVCTVVLISDDIVFIDEQRLDSSPSLEATRDMLAYESTDRVDTSRRWHLNDIKQINLKNPWVV
jgi:hypothetical protein